MYNIDIKNLINKINKTQEEITEQKIKISSLENERNNKKERNTQKFQIRFEQIDKNEKEIKSLSDNRFFNYIKLFDFLDNNDITQNKDFEVNEELGCLVKRPKSITEINISNNDIGLDNKSISYKIKEKYPINSMEYSFYSKETNLPLVPKNIIIKYDDYVDNFFENYFRYFNLNNKNNFISRYIFEPKMIKEIVFNFDEEINKENHYLKIFSIKYKDKNFVKILIKNIKQLKTFNITKKSNEAFKKLIFSYSEDDEIYNEIKFNNNESIFNLNNANDFIIKIEDNEDEVKQNNNTIIKEKILESKDIIFGKGIFALRNNDISIESIKITLPFSSSEKLREKFIELEKNIDDYFENSAGVITLKQNKIKNITETFDDVISQLKFLDDEKSIKDNENALNFYFDKEKGLLYTSAFFNKYDFYINYQYKEKQSIIDSEYFTPILFEFSLKGQ